MHWFFSNPRCILKNINFVILFSCFSNFGERTKSRRSIFLVVFQIQATTCEQGSYNSAKPNICSSANPVLYGIASIILRNFLYWPYLPSAHDAPCTCHWKKIVSKSFTILFEYSVYLCIMYICAYSSWIDANNVNGIRCIIEYPMHLSLALYSNRSNRSWASWDINLEGHIFPGICSLLIVMVNILMYLIL